LPGGNEPLTPLQWQPVPGQKGAFVYPFTRKVDTVSSNSYLVQTSGAIILIDPGGLPDQATHLASIVREARAERSRPLLSILTHAHVDHFIAARSDPLLADPEATLLAIQEAGASAIESADGRLTMADLLGQEIPPIRIDLRLVREGDAGMSQGPVRRMSVNAVEITVVREPPEFGLPREQILVGNDPPLAIYHTPGHSPDSCCIRIGGLLFIGDLPFAASPGLAGIPGWNREALIRSLAGIRELLSRGGIAVVCPGHGRILLAGDASRMLGAVQEDTGTLTGVEELNQDRARETAAFAEACMEQVNELFTVMAGRLYYVSHVMEELGEDGIAADLPALLRGDVIDDLVEDFAGFTREFHSGRYMPIHQALKGGQVISRLERTFDQEALARILDPTLLRRAERLLGDYTTMLRGYNPPREVVLVDLPATVGTCLSGHTLPSSSDEEVLASADDQEAFGRLLLARIGMPPLLSDVTVTFDAEAGIPAVPVDREHFLDLLTYLLEDLVGTGAHAITIHTGTERDAAVVTLSGEGCTGRPDGGIPRRFLSGLCERAGGTLDAREADGSRTYRIRFPLVP